MEQEKKVINCAVCERAISEKEAEISQKHYGFSVCMSCRVRAEELSKEQREGLNTTPLQVLFYLALKRRNIEAELEYEDKDDKGEVKKTVDIAVPVAKVFIELDDAHHFSTPKQNIADLQRSYHSYIKGYHTLHVFNEALRNDFLSVLREANNIIAARSKGDVPLKEV